MTDKGDQTRQLVFDFLIRYKSSHGGNSPSVRDICGGCNLATTSAGVYHLRKLEKEGRIFIGDYSKYRAIEVIGGKWRYEPELPELELEI